MELGLRKSAQEVLIYDGQVLTNTGIVGQYNVEGFYNLRVKLTTLNSGGTTPTLDFNIYMYNHDSGEKILLGSTTQITGNVGQSDLIDIRAVRHIEVEAVLGGTSPTFDTSLSLVME